jgi:hypothetical protein
MKKRCVVCNKAHGRSSLVRDGYYSDTYCHLGCLNSEAGKLWRAQRAIVDEGYGRYLTLTTHGRVVYCPACHTQCEVYLKNADVSSVWETCCDLCGRVNHDGLCAYGSKEEAELVKTLKRLEEQFLRAMDRAVEAQVELLSTQWGAMGRCDCGGRYLIAALPRCANCFTPLVESYFHYASCQ